MCVERVSGHHSFDHFEVKYSRMFCWIFLCGRFILDSPIITAPVFNQRPRYGTQAGDIYSFGIILQELALIELPYPRERLSKLNARKKKLMATRNSLIFFNDF